MLNLDCLRSRNGRATRPPGRRWLLPVLVAILCANLTGQAPALASDEQLTPIASIGKSLLNREITVQAVVGGVDRPREAGPYYVALTQAGATIPLIFWPGMQAQLGPKVKAGNLVRAKVRVSVYQDQLQLRIGGPGRAGSRQQRRGPHNESRFQRDRSRSHRSAATTPPHPAPTETVIGKIKADWVDRAVLISGTVSGSETKGTGWQLKVQDATGKIRSCSGKRPWPGWPSPGTARGWVVTVTGPVKVYEGKPASFPR